MSLKAQRDEANQLAKQKGWKVELYDEGAASAGKDGLDHRPEMMRLLAAADAGKVQHLFCYDLDRLSRTDSATSSMIKISLKEAGVTVWTRGGGQMDLSDPGQVVLMNIQSVFNWFENQKRKERFRQSKWEAVLAGRWHGGPHPYGFHVVDKRLVPEPTEAKVVAAVFDMFANGKSTMSIKTWLDEQGYKARRGGRFSLGSIRAMLKNTHHKGEYVYTCQMIKKSHTVHCPPIVDLSVWDAVEARFQRSEQRIRTRKRKHFFLLKGLLVCGFCGRLMTGRYTPKGADGKGSGSVANRYYCPATERVWVKKKLKKDQKWKRGRE